MNIGELTATLGVEDSGVKRAEEAFRQYGKTVKTTLDSVNSKMKEEQGLIGTTRRDIARLVELRDKAWDVDKIAKYNQKIQEAQRNLKEKEFP